MNAIFTIVAKNYLPQARTLGDSIKKLSPDMPFHIILVDEVNGAPDLGAEKYEVTQFKNMGFPFWRDMAYKYNVIEFSTAVKPFVFDYLFKNRNYEKIIYLDPDIYVYRDLKPVFDELENNFAVLTPHIANMEVDFTGMVTQELILSSGIYNLGFLALKRDQRVQALLEWWMKRLQFKGYIDKSDALFVDQKWMDFLPAFFDDGIRIQRNAGYNVALWNLHERSLRIQGESYFIEEKYGEKRLVPLMFFHFSGFDPNNPKIIHKRHPEFNRDSYPEFKGLLEDYSKAILGNRYNEDSKLSYAYTRYENGMSITGFQRRLYRGVTEEGFRYDDPFSVLPGSFYEVLKKNGLLVKDKSGILDALSMKNYPGADKKIKLLLFLMGILKKIVGIKLYSLLLMFLGRFSRPEKQIFLIKGMKMQTK
jgi:hypothetical protein